MWKVQFPGLFRHIQYKMGGGRVVAMVLGKHPVPGRPTIWITVGQGPTVLAVGAGGGCMDIFTLIYPFSPLSSSLWETARYRLKYCLRGSLNPKQPTNQYKMCPAKAAYLFKPLRYTTKCTVTQKEITSQTDEYLVILSSKAYVFEDKMTKY